MLLNTILCSMNINVNNNLAFYLTLYYVAACTDFDFQIHYVERIDLNCKWLICVNYYVFVISFISISTVNALLHVLAFAVSNETISFLLSE